jgi:hypothetical protein
MQHCTLLGIEFRILSNTPGSFLIQFVDRHLRSKAAILQLRQPQRCTLSFSHDPRHNNPQDLSQVIWEAKVQAHLNTSIVHHIFELHAVSQLKQNVLVHHHAYTTCSDFAEREHLQESLEAAVLLSY